MSRVALLAINAKYVHTSLSVRVIAGGIRRYARMMHDVRIIETQTGALRGADNDIADLIADIKPDVVGVSVYIWNAEVLPRLLTELRQRLPDAVFVLGGPEAGYNADFWLGHGADYVLPGEGEYRFPQLLDDLETGGCETEGQETEGRSLCFTDAKQKGRPSVSSVLVRARDEPIDPYPETGESGADHDSGRSDRILYIETSRGCPFRCAFCLSAGSGVRVFPIETAKSWLKKLSISGTKTIKLVDRTFNCDSARAYELFEYVIGLETACRFHFEAAADLFDGRTLRLLGAAPPGRIQLEMGIQSFYQPALIAASRQMDIEMTIGNIKTLVNGRNIHIHIDLIAGLPFETLPDFMDSFDRAFNLNAHTLQLGFLKLLHGSELRKRAEEYGIIYSSAPPYEIISSTWLGGEDITALKQAENALSRTYNKSRFLSALEYVLSASKLRPFSLFRELGADAPNHGTDLALYARQIFEVLIKIPGVDGAVLKDSMVCDWLRMVKGRNMPDVLKNMDSRHKHAIAEVKKQLGAETRREAVAILSSGKIAYVDGSDRDPVTGLWALRFL